METVSSFCLSSKREWDATVPYGRLLAITDKPCFRSIDNIDAYLAERLAGSFQAQKLKELAGRAGKALIICDDSTRPTPTSKILPVISRFLEQAGVSTDKQRILFATGSHREISESEAFDKIGSCLWGRIGWLSHKFNSELVKIGNTPSGIPIEVNPLLLDYRCIIGIGSVFPHRYCGWSGGGKIILPGVSGVQSVSQTHWMPYYDNSICLGNSNNLAINEIMVAAKTAGLSFLIQCICDGSGKLSDIIAGEPEEAHKSAITKAKSIMSVEVPVADVVIVQAWPEEIDLWQAGKALYAAENVVSYGGHIIVVASLREGIGPHRTYAKLMSAPEEKILKYKERRDMVGLAAAAAYATYQVRKKATISFVSDSPDLNEIADISGLKFYHNLQAAIDFLLKNNNSLTFSVLREAPLILPMAKGVNNNQ
ncbi:MAG: lactate racemase domain-containing protein [Synergistaceae bacterium]|nr:lactate racemase domain-containing protein [Synergistaceae bacterium]